MQHLHAFDAKDRGGFAQFSVQGFDVARTSDVSGAIRLGAPLAMQNTAKAPDMLHYGFTATRAGARSSTPHLGDALAKAIGFQPNVVAKESNKIREVQQTITLPRVVESEITDAWAAGIHRSAVPSSSGRRIGIYSGRIVFYGKSLWPTEEIMYDSPRCAVRQRQLGRKSLNFKDLDSI